MIRILAVLWILAVQPLVLAQEGGANEPVTVAYYYKTKWGFQDEFLRLYQKNHYPVLAAQLETGRLLDVQTYVPQFHGDGKADWTFLTILVFKDWDALNDSAHEKALIQKLYPDQATFKREEGRRFELLEAHWDIPLQPASMD